MGKLQHLQRITIWGVGLIGGSLGLALKKNGFQGERVGLGRNIDRLEKARRLGAVDFVTTDVAEALRGTDLVVLCTPVELIPPFVQSILETVDVDSDRRIILTDVGSTKEVVVQQVEGQLRAGRAESLSFVGGHPMAGSHETGVGAAHPSLFEKATCILTPTDNTDPDALEQVKTLWESVGAVPCCLAPEVHDLLVGAASHLPHLVASLLANTVAGVERDGQKALDFTATGFQDSTRIAGGSPDLWTGIFSQNRDVVLSLIDRIVDNFVEFKTLLQAGNLAAVQQLLREAQITVEERRKARGGS